MSNKRRPKKTGRRSDNEGTCYYSEARGKWVAQLPPDPLTGKRALRTAATEAEALVLLKQMQRERDGGKDMGAKQPTLEAFYTVWLDEVIAPHRAPSTAASYRQIGDLYLAPTLGRIRVEAITRQLAQQWANALAKQVKPSVVRNAYMRLCACIDEAALRGLCNGNPVRGIRLPPLEESAAQTYTLVEVRALFAAAAGWRLEALVWTLLLLGLRKGEALGAAWRSYDRKAQTLTISQQVQEINGKVTTRQKVKTKTSRRVVPVPTILAAHYDRLWKAQQDERKVRADWKEHGLMFPCENGAPLWPTNVNSAFARLCKRAGVPVLRVHDLRHTCATLLAEQGEPESVIAVLLGHAPATITRRYSHVSTETLRAAVERLAAHIEGEHEGRMAK